MVNKNLISPANNLGDDLRAELLCYLVVAQLVAMARICDWLRTNHLVESGHLLQGKWSALRLAAADRAQADSR
ncbi:hypothetical protein [Paraburkholderia sp. BL25I1N1]|uniref:hypothetical protein n=1 Tax=Paraburkholderia sp. BL25I1N1 TaxID=1938804 RepID=UPI000D04890E|nr:hypothetical protein [Paraburkholderia sp. BL25I1N1]